MGARRRLVCVYDDVTETKREREEDGGGKRVCEAVKEGRVAAPAPLAPVRNGEAREAAALGRMYEYTHAHTHTRTHLGRKLSQQEQIMMGVRGGCKLVHGPSSRVAF
eukprot:Tamp_30697.p2 GENE.Tamp_30697~~Tamp_30697.p2  ORF type:complete len:107 (+),score=14.16 Tamp_30697:351-671(+)